MVLAGRAIGAQATAPSVSASKSLSINLGSGALSGVAPFDVSFTIAGAADSLLRRVTLYVADSAVFPGTACDVHGFKAPGGVNASVWTQTRHGLPADSFRVSVAPLHANRAYTLCLHLTRSATADERTHYRASAAQALLAVVSADGNFEAETFTESGVRKAQTALKNALPAADSVAIDPKSILSVSAPINSISPEFARIATYRARRQGALSQFNIDREAATGWIVDLRSAPTGGALTALAAAQPPKDMGHSEVSRFVAITTLASGLMLTGPIALPATAAAGGQSILDANHIPAGISRPELEWDSSLVVTRVRNLDSTIALLAGIERLAEQLSSSATFRTATGVNAQPGELFKLAQAVGNTRRALAAQLRNLTELEHAVAGIQQEVDALSSSVTVLVLPYVALVGSTAGDYRTRATWHISADIGLIWVANIGPVVVPYAGANFYFSPVNKEMPLWHCPWRHAECLSKAVSATLGVTTNGVAQQGRTADLFASNDIFAGVGARVSDFLRVSGGGLFFRQITNVTNNRMQLAVRPAFTASIDADLRDLLGAIGSIFPK